MPLTREQIEEAAVQEIKEILEDMDRRIAASEPHVTALNSIWDHDTTYPPSRAWELAKLMQPSPLRTQLSQSISERSDAYHRISGS